MFIVGLLSWWYTAGWWHRVHRLHEKLESTLDYFSIGLLLRTLFSPFRQISAGRVRGPLGVQLRAWVDRLVSRLIGAMVRTVVIFVGLVTIVVHVVLGSIIVIGWALVPLLPVVGAVVAYTGWVPSWSL